MVYDDMRTRVDNVIAINEAATTAQFPMKQIILVCHFCSEQFLLLIFTVSFLRLSAAIRKSFEKFAAKYDTILLRFQVEFWVVRYRSIICSDTGIACCRKYYLSIIMINRIFIVNICKSNTKM